MPACRVCGKSSHADERFCSECGTNVNGGAPTGLLPPQSLLHEGRYEIVERVGRGGMGSVYKALDLVHNGHVVAVKEMSQNGLTDQDLQYAITSFTREANMLLHLKHESLPDIYEQFEEDGRRYLVMEFIEGVTLERLLEKYRMQKKRMPVGHVLSISMQLATVLDYLHTRTPPVVFRDLKPANVMLNARGQVYLIDFGIARVFVQGQGKDTAALGSEGYAPPEQYRQATSPRSDIYALGATMHQMLTGDDPVQRPFHFRSISLGIPALERLVRNMVALEETHRPQNVKEVLKLLQGVATSLAAATKASENGKSTRQASITMAPILPGQLTISVALAPSIKDKKLWGSLKDHLLSLLDTFPDMRIEEVIVTGDDQQKHLQAIDNGYFVLLLLSKDFLTSSACMTLAERALRKREAQGIEVLSVLLRPCAVEKQLLARLRVVSEDAITHVSLYAQEQRIVEVAKVIRKHLVKLVLTDKRDGPMNLLQWLLWQMYGDGHVSCPYFVVGRYALKYIRPSGFAGVLIHVLDLYKGRAVAEYTVGSHTNASLASLLQVIAPSLPNLEAVQGVASRNKPQEFSMN